MKSSSIARGDGYCRDRGDQMLDSNNRPVRLAAGVNQYGFKTADEIAPALWAQHCHSVLSEIESDSHNLIWMPFSNQLAETAINQTSLTENVTHSPRVVAGLTLEVTRYLRARAVEVRPAADTVREASLPKCATVN